MLTIKDICELKSKELELAHRLKFEKLVASISTQLIMESDLDKAINSSLATIGSLNHASRSYIFLTDENSKTISNTHEWCAEGIEPQKEHWQNLPLAGLPWWIETLQNGEIIHIDDTSKMPKKAKAEKNLLLLQKIKSVLVLPLFLSSKLEGFVGFDNVRETGRWTDENIALLKIYGDIIGKAIGNERAIEALQKSEKRFSDIAYSTGDWIWEIDTNGYYTYSNFAVEQILGYNADEVIGKLFIDFSAPEEVDRIRKQMYDFSISRKAFRGYQNKCIHKNGSIVFLETSGVPIYGPKGFEGYRGTNHNITKSKNIENNLRQEYHKLEVVTENIGVGFAIIDRNYRMLWQNKFLKKVKGDAQGQLCHEALHRSSSICENCGVKKIFENGSVFDSHEIPTVDDEGNQRWIDLNVSPIFDENGNVVSAIEMAIDTTEKKLLENQLAEYSTDLEGLVQERTKQLKEAQAKLVKTERLAAIGELAGMVGHDIRNPLTGIKNAAYYLETKGNAITDEKRKVMIDVINRSINQANKIVNDLLDYSREICLDLTECSPKTILDNALLTVQVPEHIRILDNTLEEHKMMVDPAKLERVFINLITNAIDAISEKGTITITSAIKDTNVEIAFSDTGKGIPKENVEKMFTPLFTTKAKGMGLGLAICKRIVEAHNGKISIESTVGKGTTFTVSLPIKQKSKVGGENVWVATQESLLSTTTKT